MIHYRLISCRSCMYGTAIRTPADRAWCDRANEICSSSSSPGYRWRSSNGWAMSSTNMPAIPGQHKRSINVLRSNCDDVTLQSSVPRSTPRNEMFRSICTSNTNKTARNEDGRLDNQGVPIGKASLTPPSVRHNYTSLTQSTSMCHSLCNCCLLVYNDINRCSINQSNERVNVQCSGCYIGLKTG